MLILLEYMNTYFIKLGGSVITDTNKPYTANISRIRSILGKIKEAQAKGRMKVLIGHGGGSFPHIPAHKYKVNDGLVHKFSWKGASITHYIAEELNRIVVNEGLKLGLKVFSFVPSSFALWHDGLPQSGYAENIKEALNRGFVPVVYGDAVFDSRKGVTIASTENVFSFLSRWIRPSRIILATDVDGVFDKDPKSNKDAKLIKVIDSTNIDKVLNGASGSHKIDVTGGMASKLATLYQIVKQNDSMGIIVNGLKSQALAMALKRNIDEESGYFTVVKP
ncbi:MAG: isopentenyl phosphate kinase, partial [Candidatus Micrarchaeia archaeon]